MSITSITGRPLPPPAGDDGYAQVLETSGGYPQMGQTLSRNQASDGTDPTRVREPNVLNETHYHSSIYESHYSNDNVASGHHYNNTNGPLHNEARSSNNLTQDSALDIESICIHTKETSDYTNIYDTPEDNTYTQAVNQYSTPTLETSMKNVLKNQNA